LVGVGGGDVRPDHVAAIAADLRARTTSGQPLILETAEAGA
jgi:hypothetical protein